ncbi:MAG: cytochrome c peroxidase [bacterium]|nr:cytochrome c peroxidase [bacterium]MDT8366187.1 cytochrome c peroxidase [bacterium]
MAGSNRFLSLILVLGSLLVIFPGTVYAGVHDWSPGEVRTLKSLWIKSLPTVPQDPSNAYGDDKLAASLGRKFFFDKRFSGNAKVSCGTCHRVDYAFTDDLPLAHGMGTTGRRTMTLIGSAYYPWLFWDGRKDSLWSQALGPLESSVEHGISRVFVVSIIFQHYRKEYEDIFGPLPPVGKLGRLLARPASDDPGAFKGWLKLSLEDREAVNRVYVNLGKAIAAYVRTILPGISRFDEYVAALNEDRAGDLKGIFTDQEAEGLRIFIGKAKCTNCHSGPLFTNGEFHNLDIPVSEKMPFDAGRAEGISLVLADEFNCLGNFSDAKGKQCQQLWWMDTDTRKYNGAMKTPTLRNVVERPPYMHAGQFNAIREVLDFYRGSKNPDIEHQSLTNSDLKALEAFLGTLSGPILSLGE